MTDKTTPPETPEKTTPTIIHINPDHGKQTEEEKAEEIAIYNTEVEAKLYEDIRSLIQAYSGEVTCAQVFGVFESLKIQIHFEHFLMAEE
jgi:hypothetical protein